MPGATGAEFPDVCVCEFETLKRSKRRFDEIGCRLDFRSRRDILDSREFEKRLKKELMSRAGKLN